MSENIRITDLAEPELSELQKSIHAYGETLQVFPNATIAATHRDPVSVIQSAATMIAYGQRMSRNTIDLKSITDYWSDRVVHLLEACARDRGKLPDSQSIDVPFHKFMADDISMVRKIYAMAGLPVTKQAATELQLFIDDHPRGKHGRVVYKLKEDFGVDPDELRKPFDFYFKQFPVQAETKS